MTQIFKPTAKHILSAAFQAAHDGASHLYDDAIGYDRHTNPRRIDVLDEAVKKNARFLQQKRGTLATQTHVQALLRSLPSGSWDNPGIRDEMPVLLEALINHAAAQTRATYKTHCILNALADPKTSHIDPSTGMAAGFGTAVRFLKAHAFEFRQATYSITSRATPEENRPDQQRTAATLADPLGHWA